MAHEVHPKKVIESKNGKIVMEKPDLSRTTAMANSIYTYILTDDDLLALNEMKDEKERNMFIKRKSLKKGFTSMQITMLAYVTSAPFHLNDYAVEPILDLRSFLEYADTDLIAKMSKAMDELGKIDPLSV